MEPVKAHLGRSYASFIHLCTVHQRQQAYQYRVGLDHDYDSSRGDPSAVRVQISVAVFERDDGEDENPVFCSFSTFYMNPFDVIKIIKIPAWSVFFFFFVFTQGAILQL